MNNTYLFEYRTKGDTYIQEAAYWPENDFQAVSNAMKLLNEKEDLLSIVIYKRSGMFWTDAASVTHNAVLVTNGSQLVKYYKGDYEYINVWNTGNSNRNMI